MVEKDPKKLLEKVGKLLDLPVEDLLLRSDDRVEWKCDHGIGHTVYNPNDWGEYKYLHGCDGCCNNIKKI